MIRDSIHHKGYVDLVLTDHEGQIKQKLFVNNLVVQTGKNYIAHRMGSAGNTLMSHMAVGSNDTAAALNNTALLSELGRVTLTSTTVTANVVTYAATFSAGTPAGTAAITEAGIFNASSGGEMLCRTTFSVINKSPLDTLTITWTITNS